MKATEAKLLDFLKKSPQFVIPIYQRTYSWTERECLQLWEDIIRTGSNKELSAHFVGSIVYIEQGLYRVINQPPLLVIDGQQRLTTVTILIEALARMVGDKEPVDGFSARKMRNYYLLNPEEDGERGYKLLLTQTDKETLLALVQQKEPTRNKSKRVSDNFKFFKDKLAGYRNDLSVVCQGLAKLMIVDISLSRDQDNPQLIFESMNSTGKELTQADLIRNYILMGLEPGHQTALYEDHWRPMEVEFGQEAYGDHFDSFMRHYLTIKTGDIPNIRAVYDAFKTYSSSKKISELGVDALVEDIHQFAKYYCSIALGQEADRDLKLAFQDLKELRVEVSYPLLLELYHDYINEVLTKDDLVKAVRVIESYVFRRAICSIPTNSLNKTFATISKSIDKENYLESLFALLMVLPSYRRFPQDDEFERALKSKDIYNLRSKNYWFRRLENYKRKEKVYVDEYTIEHIMPQNENLSKAWRDDLGPEWKRIRDTWLHTIGNLTLTGYNTEYSDRPFAQKRDMKGGFKDSPLKLNEGLGSLDTWNEDTIVERSERLSGLAVKIWTYPDVSSDIIERYRVKGRPSEGYSLLDHPYLANEGQMLDLFRSFRKEVMSIDPCVSEEILKYYIAFKAETNFVDVEPQAKRLKLILNIKYADLNDPKGLAKDVSALGKWGNGDAEVRLSSQDEIPYVMGLVRQAFNKQMTNGDSTT